MGHFELRITSGTRSCSAHVKFWDILHGLPSSYREGRRVNERGDRKTEGTPVQDFTFPAQMHR
jgi:hypothetical protein